MNDKLIIAIVVLVAVAAHWWLWRWVRFKIDEGLIIKQLGAGDTSSSDLAADIAARTDLKPARVVAVCKQSSAIREDGKGVWRLKP